MDHLKEVQAYWDKRSHGFSDAINEEADSELGRQWKERFRKLLGEQPLEILDDGAGAGFFSMLLASLGHHVTSIDYSEKMVERLRENMASRGLAASALQMDAQRLEFPDGRFDAVVQRNVLWNLDDPAAAYGEMHRVLRPGGLLLVDDGNHYLASHDEEYAAENERLRQRRLAEGAGRPAGPGDHYAHNPEQVDFTIIERIASEQPLSYVRRPQWDVDQLIRLGFFDLQIHIDGERLPRHFLISARKKAE
jgi:ubiquinone/menaquinone biosynthesis C-methylase UbiE